MITRAEAEGIVLDRLNKNADASHRAAILDAWIKPYGWVVLYDSELFVQTGNDFDRFFGNGPFVVMHDGAVHTLGRHARLQSRSLRSSTRTVSRPATRSRPWKGRRDIAHRQGAVEFWANQVSAGHAANATTMIGSERAWSGVIPPSPHAWCQKPNACRCVPSRPVEAQLDHEPSRSGRLPGRPISRRGDS